jgi:hypothetical protein
VNRKLKLSTPPVNPPFKNHNLNKPFIKPNDAVKGRKNIKRPIRIAIFKSISDDTSVEALCQGARKEKSKKNFRKYPLHLY